MAWGVSEVWATPHHPESVRVETWPCSSVESRHRCKGVFHNPYYSIYRRANAPCSRYRTLYGMERESRRSAKVEGTSSWRWPCSSSESRHSGTGSLRSVGDASPLGIVWVETWPYTSVQSRHRCKRSLA